MAKKKKTVKKAAKKAAKKKPAKKTSVTKTHSGAPKPGKKDTPPANPKRVAIDPKRLSNAENSKRIATIYALEAHIEKKQAMADLAKQTSRAANAALKAAKEALSTEIDGQRFGPGDLFNADGSGAAGE